MGLELNKHLLGQTCWLNGFQIALVACQIVLPTHVSMVRRVIKVVVRRLDRGLLEWSQREPSLLTKCCVQKEEF